MRHLRLTLAIEAAIWTAVMGWLFYLAFDFCRSYRGGSHSWRDLLEIALLALLVYWPIVRVRIQRGYWMRDWDDERPATAEPDPRRGRRQFQPREKLPCGRPD